ncbi:hypothetical protein EYC80_007725 [Monilinia laxa]|uniref:Uncharacterized protein n=1 Tax=Monilinia laxa TaxID=61186 RepID=A0A5N6JWT5_MONLA|nr:hypothetical protein EYC80_007725 [Monilinia laxa]
MKYDYNPFNDDYIECRGRSAKPSVSHDHYFNKPLQQKIKASRNLTPALNPSIQTFLAHSSTSKSITSHNLLALPAIPSHPIPSHPIPAQHNTTQHNTTQHKHTPNLPLLSPLDPIHTQHLTSLIPSLIPSPSHTPSHKNRQPSQLPIANLIAIFRFVPCVPGSRWIPAFLVFPFLIVLLGFLSLLFALFLLMVSFDGLIWWVGGGWRLWVDIGTPRWIFSVSCYGMLVWWWYGSWYGVWWCVWWCAVCLGLVALDFDLGVDLHREWSDRWAWY